MIRVNATIDSTYFVDVATANKVLRSVEAALEARFKKEGGQYSLSVSFSRGHKTNVIVENNINWGGINYQPNNVVATIINHDCQRIIDEAANKALFG